MSQKLRQLVIVFTVLLTGLAVTARVHAQCAVCAVALIGGLGISRWLGVDDIYVGVWLGAAIIAVSGFAGNLLVKRFPKYKWLRWVAQVIIVAIFGVALYFADGYIKAGQLTHLAQGIIIGVISIYLGLYLDKALRKLKNDGGKPYFPFQKVVCPVVLVLLGTLGAWILVS